MTAFWRRTSAGGVKIPSVKIFFVTDLHGSEICWKKFLNAGNNEWGQKMQDDITWGVKHLVSEGIADPKRVGILGGSYGGYATLAGVAFTPELYRAAVDIVGPSNLITLLEAIPLSDVAKEQPPLQRRLRRTLRAPGAWEMTLGLSVLRKWQALSTSADAV